MIPDGVSINTDFLFRKGLAILAFTFLSALAAIWGQHIECSWFANMGAVLVVIGVITGGVIVVIGFVRNAFSIVRKVRSFFK